MPDNVEDPKGQGVSPGLPSLVGILVSWLMGINTWSRAGIAIVLGFGVLVGYEVYQNPQQVFELLSAAFRPAPPQELPYMTPMYSAVRKELQRLLDSSTANMLGVAGFKVDIITNKQTLVAALARPTYEAGMKQLEEYWKLPQAAFRDDSVVNDIVVKLYLGRFVCIPPGKDWVVTSVFPFIEECCFIAVPPDGIGLAGFIAGAWVSKIPDYEKARIETVFRDTANAIVWHRAQRTNSGEVPP